MNYKSAISRCYEEKKEYFDSIGVTKHMLMTMWDIYYESLREEMFNKDRTKVFVQQPNIGIFKHDLGDWRQVVANLKKITSLKSMNKETRLNGTPDRLVDFFRKEAYPFVRKELDIMDQYLSAYETYNDVAKKRKEENILLYNRGLKRKYEVMNNYQDEMWDLLKKVKKRNKTIHARIERNKEKSIDNLQEKTMSDES